MTASMACTTHHLVTTSLDIQARNNGSEIISEMKSRSLAGASKSCGRAVFSCWSLIISAVLVMKFGKRKIKVEKNSSFGYNNGSFHAENQLREKCAEEYLLELLGRNKE